MIRRKLTIVSGIFPPDIGGPASYVPRIAGYLVSEGWEVSVVCLSDQVPMLDASKYPFKVIRISRSLFKPIRFIRTTWVITKASWGSCGIFSNGLFTESALSAKIARRKLLIKIVGDPSWERSQNRGWFKGTIDEYQVAKKNLILRVMDSLRNWAVDTSHLIITPSIYLKKVVGYWGVSPNRIKVIYNSCPISESKIAINSCERSIDVIVVARLAPWKGIDAVVKAVARLKNLRLAIVGDGPCFEEISELISGLNVNDRVTMYGKMPHSQVLKMLRESKIFILNSSYEGMPHVLIEAFLSGCHILSSDSGGSRELIEMLGQGKIFKYNDVDEISKQIEACLTDVRDSADILPSKLLENFSETRMFKQTEEEFRSCFLSKFAEET